MPRADRPADPVAAIRKLYYATTERTVEHDLREAIALFKRLTSEAERERVAVYMDGLSQMRSEWAAAARARRARPAGNKRKTS